MVKEEVAKIPFEIAFDQLLLLKLSNEQLSELYAFAYELYRNGKYADSKQFFRFLTIANTFDRRFWMGLGASYQMLGEHKAAIECYSVAAVQKPQDPYVHKYAADCFFAEGDIAQAVKTLESSITVARQNDKETLVQQLTLIHTEWTKLLETEKLK